jgi:hypothetical protein
LSQASTVALSRNEPRTLKLITRIRGYAFSRILLARIAPTIPRLYLATESGDP